MLGCLKVCVYASVFDCALQGIGSSIRRLGAGKVCTPTVQSASLASILKPVVQSGALCIYLNLSACCPVWLHGILKRTAAPCHLLSWRPPTMPWSSPCCDVLSCFYGRLFLVVLSYAMLCHAMPCYAILCHTMLCHAMLCHAMLCYAMLCYAMLRYAMLCYAMLWPCGAAPRSVLPISNRAKPAVRCVVHQLTCIQSPKLFKAYAAPCKFVRAGYRQNSS